MREAFKGCRRCRNRGGKWDGGRGRDSLLRDGHNCQLRNGATERHALCEGLPFHSFMFVCVFSFGEQLIHANVPLCSTTCPTLFIFSLFRCGGSQSFGHKPHPADKKATRAAQRFKNSSVFFSDLSEIRSHISKKNFRSQ